MSRATMHFRTREYGPYCLTLMEGNEPGYCEGQPLLVSVAGPGLPRIRVTPEGPVALDEETEGPLPTHGGLIVFGWYKGDRPRLRRTER